MAQKTNFPAYAGTEQSAPQDVKNILKFLRDLIGTYEVDFQLQDPGSAIEVLNKAMQHMGVETANYAQLDLNDNEYQLLRYKIELDQKIYTVWFISTGTLKLEADFFADLTNHAPEVKQSFEANCQMLDLATVEAPASMN